LGSANFDFPWRRSRLSTQMQRYFAATLGFGFAAVWNTVGLGAAVTCALGSGACFGIAVAVQRRMFSRAFGSISAPSQRRARPSSMRPERAKPVPQRTRPVERKDARSDALIPVSDYGW
jgi:hypothetical protein